MSAPISKIPVRIVGPGEALPPPSATVALIRLEAPHRHEDGSPCPACRAATDIRARLADLLETMERASPPPTAVVVDARRADPARAAAALRGHLPAEALRDHIVARRFTLS